MKCHGTILQRISTANLSSLLCDSQTTTKQRSRERRDYTGLYKNIQSETTVNEKEERSYKSDTFTLWGGVQGEREMEMVQTTIRC